MFRTLRRLWQLVFFALFVWLVVVTTASLVGGWPVEWFFAVDPLVAVVTALGRHALPVMLLWAVPMVVLTLVFGRFFCGWMYPFGTLHQVFGFAGKLRRARDRIDLNRPRRIYDLKYFILIGMLAAAALGSTQVGLLDPIATSWRAFATVLVPAADNLTGGQYHGPRHFHASTLIAGFFVAALALNLWIPRLYCRMLCPAGALFGLLARFSLFRLERDVSRCTDCNVCGADCQGAAEPQGRLRATECLLCLNCVGACKKGGMKYRFLPSPELTVDHLDLGRRRTLTALAAGVVFVPLARASDGVGPRADPRRIRPPGALVEEDFLELCLKCGACMQACPTGGLQPALGEAGLEGLWTPVLMPRLGWCEQGCVLCTQVCPTGALEKLTIARKLGQPPAHEPVRIGSAFVDRGRCLPWAVDTSCIVCEEVCPTAPKAVYFKLETVVTRDGGSRTLKRPFVDLTRCTGCGVCESQCPVADEAAIRVTSVGETRSPRNRVLVGRGV
jgi:MauM/NapG family ferredoxin protein